MIADIDKDGSGTIDFDEFLQMMTAKMSEKDSREEILKAFRLFDDDETGKISFKNLKRVAKELGENMTDEELQVGHPPQYRAPSDLRAHRNRHRQRASPPQPPPLETHSFGPLPLALALPPLPQEMIDEADRDGDGEINEEEFLRIMKKTSLY